MDSTSKDTVMVQKPHELDQVKKVTLASECTGTLDQDEDYPVEG
jgi:hypothetical protein